jgi:hypothetical protein
VKESDNRRGEKSELKILNAVTGSTQCGEPGVRGGSDGTATVGFAGDPIELSGSPILPKQVTM